MVQDLMIKLARKPKETIKAYKFWLPKMTYNLETQSTYTGYIVKGIYIYIYIYISL